MLSNRVEMFLEALEEEEWGGENGLKRPLCRAGVNFTNILRAAFTSSFYEQLLRAQIPKAQKDSQLKQLFAFLGICGSKSFA